MILTGRTLLGSSIGDNSKVITIAQSFKDTTFLCFTQLSGTDSNGFQIFARPAAKNQIRFQTINLNSGICPFLCYGKWK